MRGHFYLYFKVLGVLQILSRGNIIKKLFNPIIISMVLPFRKEDRRNYAEGTVRKYLFISDNFINL
jgi:hypothetical protein